MKQNNVIGVSITFGPQMKRVDTLPCEILILENCTDQTQATQQRLTY